MLDKEISQEGWILLSGTRLAESLIKILIPEGDFFIIPHVLTQYGLFFSYIFYKNMEVIVFIENFNHF